MPSPYAPMPRCLYPAQVAAKEAEVQTLKQRLHTSGSGRMGGGGGDASASGLGSITFHPMSVNYFETRKLLYLKIPRFKFMWNARQR